MWNNLEGNWKEAVQKFYDTEFPTGEFNDRRVEYEREEDETKKLCAGISKSNVKHNAGDKESDKHFGRKTNILQVITIDGYEVDAWESYCFKCGRVFESGMSMFNNETNECARIKTLKDSIEDKLVFS